MSQRRKHRRLSDAVRREIQNSAESARALAARLGVDRKTIAKWRARDDIADAARVRVKPRASTVLSAEQEAIIIGFRTGTALPLDDCFYALQDHIPELTRSTLYRCLKRHGVARLPARVRQSRSAALGRIHIAIGDSQTGEGKRHVLVATDLASRWFVAKVYRRADARTAAEFLGLVARRFDWRIRSVVTVKDAPFYANHGDNEFQRASAALGCTHDMVETDPIWLRVQSLRGLQVGARATYRTEAALARYVAAFAPDFNFRSRLKSLRGRTPYQFVCAAWTKDPSGFRRNPHRRAMDHR